MALLRGVDYFVTDGGSVTEWDDACVRRRLARAERGRGTKLTPASFAPPRYVFVGFTVSDADAAYANFSYVFQVDKYDAATVYNVVRVPRAVWGASGNSGMYRARPYASVAGEGYASPFEAH